LFLEQKQIISISETNCFSIRNNQKKGWTKGMLPELFKSEDRLRILRYVAEREIVTVQTVAKATAVSKPVVSRYMHVLIKSGLCTRTGRILSWIPSPVGSAMKRFLNIILLDEHLPHAPWAEGIGIYGSFARGTNNAGSDVDVWILVSEHSQEVETHVAELRHTLSHSLGYDVHMLLLTRKKLQDLSQKDPPFYEEFMKDQVVVQGAAI
jgi:predicted nucleotidyltransferase